MEQTHAAVEHQKKKETKLRNNRPVKVLSQIIDQLDPDTKFSRQNLD